MFQKYFKNLSLVILCLSYISFAPTKILAEDIGDQYYPTAADKLPSVEKMQQIHDSKMQQAEEEYKRKLSALEKSYNIRNEADEAHLKKTKELREKAAELKEERLKKRQELDMALLKNSQKLQNKDFEKYNRYVIDSKDHKEYFESKAKKKAEQQK